ncbi:uncharacterized protein VTP21DRAFT_7791 [Calcarisporiella thermophila]|uniref:uncharacterized protein n=1 Tax=Calcarisporiella thermophila TaxID=911321 RepID=UPI0037423697
MDTLKQYMKLISAGVCQLMKPGPFVCDLYCRDFPNTTLIEYFQMKVGDVVGYVARDDNRKAIVIVFRGAITIESWSEIIKGVGPKQPFDPLDSSKGTVHFGFLEAYNAAKDHIGELLMKQIMEHPGYEVEVLGWSYGGAMASLNAMDLWNRLKIPAKKIVLVTFGQPRVGDQVYADWVDKSGILIKRLVHKNDIVPHLGPDFLGYRHHSAEIHTNALTGRTTQCVQPEDKECSYGVPLALLNAIDHFQNAYGVFMLGCSRDALVGQISQLKDILKLTSGVNGKVDDNNLFI